MKNEKQKETKKESEFQIMKRCKKCGHTTPVTGYFTHHKGGAISFTATQLDGKCWRCQEMKGGQE